MCVKLRKGKCTMPCVSNYEKENVRCHVCETTNREMYDVICVRLNRNRVMYDVMCVRLGIEKCTMLCV